MKASGSSVHVELELAKSRAGIMSSIRCEGESDRTQYFWRRAAARKRKQRDLSNDSHEDVKRREVEIESTCTPKRRARLREAPQRR